MKRLPKNLKLGDLVLLDWNDAYQRSAGWTTIAPLQKENACQCFSVGLYVGQNKAGDVIIGSSWDTGPHSDKAVNGVQARPLDMIQRIKILIKGNKIK